MQNTNLKEVQADVNSDLNDGYDEKIYNEFVNFKNTSGVSLQKIGLKIKKSVATLSQYLSKKYPGDIKSLETLIETFLRRESGIEEVKVSTRAFQNTSISTLIWETLQFADFLKKMGVVLAPSGSGKTVTCLEYKSKNPSTILITADPTNRTPAQILRLMLKDVGLSKASSIGQMLYEICDRLKGTNRLVIVDEAHFLVWESFEILRKIFDHSGVGVVLCGQERLYDQMKGQAQRAYLYDQIFSRIAIKRDRFKILKKDSNAIATAVCPGLTAECLDFLYTKAQGKGRYRYMINILDVAMMMREQYEKPINIQSLSESERFLLGE